MEIPIDFDSYKKIIPCENCNGTGEITVIDNKRLGALLQKLRKKDGLKLHDVARQMDLSVGYISDLEHARRKITSDLFMKYIFALEVAKNIVETGLDR